MKKRPRHLIGYSAWRWQWPSGFARADATNQHDIALLGDEAAASERKRRGHAGLQGDEEGGRGYVRVTQLASLTVGVPFVGLIAGVLVIAELLRRLHGGIALKLTTASALALETLDSGPMQADPYAFAMYWSRCKCS